MKNFVCLFTFLYSMSAQATLFKPLTLKIVEKRQKLECNQPDLDQCKPSLVGSCQAAQSDKKSIVYDCEVPSPGSSPVPDSPTDNE